MVSRKQGLFQIGDIVTLKSGGPKMSVQNVVDDWVQCKWFAGAKANTEDFHPDTLTLEIDEPKK